VTTSAIREIEHIVQTTLYPDELYETFLAALLAALDARGAAIWRLEESGDAELSAFVGVSDQLGRDAWDEHRALIAAAIGANPFGQTTYSPGEPGNRPGLPLLIQRVHPRSPLVIEVAARAGASPTSLRGDFQFLQQSAELLATAKCIPWE
jgi:hypothetical protein